MASGYKKQKYDYSIHFKSKQLIKKLRHDAVLANNAAERERIIKKGDLPIDKHGYALIEDLEFLGWKVKELQDIMAEDDKKRFTMSDRRIRAENGHSIEGLDMKYTLITDPSKYPVVVHGTYSKNIDSIMRYGLHRRSRNEIHFTTVLDTRKNLSGFRDNADTLIHIDMEAAMRDGLTFYITGNNVILCPGNKDGYLLPKYITHTTSRH